MVYRTTVLAVAIASMLVGCASPHADDMPDRIASAANSRRLIVFTSEGQPTDVPTTRPSDRELTLQDAIETALQNDPAVQAAGARLDVALADARQSRLLPNPVLSVAVRFPEGGGKPIIDASLAADLIAVLKMPREIDAADRRLGAASAEVLAAAIDSVAQVEETYARVQAVDAQVQILRQRRAILERLAHLADARVQAGESARLDLITAQAEVAEIDAELAALAAERGAQRLTLVRMLGQPSGPIDWQLSPWSAAPIATLGDERDWIATALQQNPEIQSRQWELAALGDEAATASLGALDGAEVGVDSERDGDWSVGPELSIPVPLMDWGQQRKARANALRAESRHELTLTRRKVVEDVRREFAATTAAFAAVRIAFEQAVPAQQQRLAQANAAYQNGAADITTVLLAEQDLQLSRSREIESQKNLSIAVARLQRAVGGPGVAKTLPATRPTIQITETQP